MLLENSEVLVLRVSRNAAQRINEIAVQAIFMGITAFTSIQMDYAELPMLLLKGMRVIITQNRDKKLPNSNIVAIHTVTEVTEDGSKRVFYPLVPAYVPTICKIQGQTLHKVIIW